MKTRSLPMETTSQASPFLYAGLFVLLTALFSLGIHQVLANNSLGADFYVFWTAGRAFFIENQNPYSEDITRQIQLAVYHRLALPTEDQIQFSYPAYVLVMVLPYILMDYAWAQAAWMSFNLVSMLTLSLLLFPKAPRWILISTALVYNVLYGAVVGNFSLIISLVLFLFFGYFVFRQGRSVSVQIAIGFLLAWSTAKPQSVWLYLIFALLFSYRARLWPLLRSFGISMIGLLILPFLIQPNWLNEWVSNLSIYVGFTGQNRGIMALLTLFYPGAMSAALVNSAFMVAALILVPVAALLFYRWWQSRISDFALLTGLAAITYLLLPNNSSADQMFLLLPLLLWCLWQSAERAAARWIWFAFLLYSYLIFFAEILHIVPHAILFGHLVFFAAWAAWWWFVGIKHAEEHVL